jgi:hypothetical protein
MSLTGYLDTDGRELEFGSAAEFDAYQATKQAGWSWQQIQDQAIHTATALMSIFTQPAILSPDLLEQTKGYEWLLPSGLKLTVPVGWYLWIVSVQREAGGPGWQEAL